MFFEGDIVYEYVSDLLDKLNDIIKDSDYEFYPLYINVAVLQKLAALIAEAVGKDEKEVWRQILEELVDTEYEIREIEPLDPSDEEFKKRYKEVVMKIRTLEARIILRLDKLMPELSDSD